MAVTGSHASPFKNYHFGICAICGHRTLYQGRTRNPVRPMYYQRCRYCKEETFSEAPDRSLITV